MPVPKRRLDGIAIGAFLGVLGTVAAGALATAPDDPSAPPKSPSHAGPLTAVQAPIPDDRDLRRTAVVAATETATPAVVSITTETTYVDFFRRPQVSSGEGSGVIIDSEGIVLTNYHVVEQAQRIQASTSDGRTFSARFIGGASELDLAVLRLEGAKDLPTVPIGTSSDLLLGEPVIAIGNPYGLGHTVTTGVVSAVSRPLETSDRVYQEFIQTDASINPGNSGGPLLSVTGRLIGINTAIREGAEGIGFAIPADRALKVARDLVQFGTVQLPWLGVDLADRVERSPSGRKVGVHVLRVHPEGGGALVGVLRGDRIRRIGGHEVQSVADLNAWLSALEPGAEVELELARDSAPVVVHVATGAVPPSVVDRALEEVLGISLGRGIPGVGVPIARVSPDGELGRAGFRTGDIIVQVNGAPIESADALRQRLKVEKSGHRHQAAITLRRGDRGGTVFFSI